LNRLEVRKNEISNLIAPVSLHQKRLILIYISIFWLFQVLFGGFGNSEKIEFH